MLWVDGSDLEQLLSDLGPLPIERAVEVIANVADALDAAHERGFVHRDVKPANVLVADSGQVLPQRLRADQGLDASTGLDDTRQLLGTVDYVAPEQIEGRPVVRPAPTSTASAGSPTAPSPAACRSTARAASRDCGRTSTSPRRACAPSVPTLRAPSTPPSARRREVAEERFATAGAFAIAAREALGEMARRR